MNFLCSSILCFSSTPCESHFWIFAEKAIPALHIASMPLCASQRSAPSWTKIKKLAKVFFGPFVVTYTSPDSVSITPDPSSTLLSTMVHMALANMPNEVVACDLFMTSIPHAVNQIVSSQIFDVMSIPEMLRNTRACNHRITTPWTSLTNPFARPQFQTRVSTSRRHVGHTGKNFGITVLTCSSSVRGPITGITGC